MPRATSRRPDPAHVPFQRWMELYHQLVTSPQEVVSSPGWEDANGEAQAAAGREIRAVTSLASAAAQALTVIYTDTGEDITPAEILADDTEDEAKFCLRLLACLAPHLSGPITDYVSDVLDHPNRPIGDCLLARATVGRA